MSKATLLNNAQPPLWRGPEGPAQPRSLWGQYNTQLNALVDKAATGPITSVEHLRDVKRMAELRKGQGNLPLFSDPVALEPPYTPFRPTELTDMDRYVLGYTGSVCLSPAARWVRGSQAVPIRVTAPVYRPVPVRWIRTVMFEEDAQPQATLGVLLGLSADWITGVEIVVTPDDLNVQLVCPGPCSDMLLGLLYVHYPRSRFEILGSDLLGERPLPYARSYCLSSPHLFPLKEMVEREDALSYLAGATEVLRRGERAVLQILVTPCRADWGYNLEQATQDELTGASRAAEIDLGEMVGQKTRAPFFAVVLRTAGTSPEAMHRLHRYLGLFRTEYQELVPLEEGAGLWPVIKARVCYRPGLLLSGYEVAALAHVPTAQVRSDRLERVKIPQVRAPRDLTEGVLIGVNRYRNQEILIRLSDALLNRHMLIAGATRMGKSTLLAVVIRDIMGRGLGLALFDPKGSLARTILRLVPRHRRDDVIYFRANDREFPFSLNIFQLGQHRPKSDVIQDFITLVDRTTHVRGDPLTARMIRLLRNAMLVFFEIEGATLRDITRFLDDRQVRQEVLGRLDPERHRFLIRFWENIDERVDPRIRYDVSAEGIINRLDQFVGDEVIGKLLCQRTCKLDFEDIVTNNRILIVDLSDIGQERRGILGRLLVTELELSAMGRPVDRRMPFRICLDEAQEFMTPSIQDVLSMGAEYRVSMILSHQNMSQIPQELRSSIFGNTGTAISFRVGPDYGSLMSRQFGEKFEPRHFTQLPPYETLVAVDGKGFTMSALPPEWEREDFVAPDFSEEIIRRCRAQYARPLHEVQQEWDQSMPAVEVRREERRRAQDRLNIQGEIAEEEKRELFEQIVEALSGSDPAS